MTDPQTPATEAGRDVADQMYEDGHADPFVIDAILAIEAEARADALREAAERVRAMERMMVAPARADAVDRAAVLAILDPQP